MNCSQIRKEDVRLINHILHDILCRKPYNCAKKLLDQINELSKVEVYKINIQKLVTHLYSNTELS